jgi:hypothetical protein
MDKASSVGAAGLFGDASSMRTPSVHCQGSSLRASSCGIAGQATVKRVDPQCGLTFQVVGGIGRGVDVSQDRGDAGAQRGERGDLVVDARHVVTKRADQIPVRVVERAADLFERYAQSTKAIDSLQTLDRFGAVEAMPCCRAGRWIQQTYVFVVM